jgi:hypothetical protein
MSRSTTIELADGKLFALQDTMTLDGRIAAYPLAARGFAPVNLYLLREPDGALLLDTGFTAHLPAIIARLERLLAPKIPLSLCPLRINEFMSVSNTIPLARHFAVEGCLTMMKDAPYWLDFESITDEDIADSARVLPVRLISGEEWLDVGSQDRRPIKFFQSPIRLIATRWIYDPATRTLFTSDMFTHNWGAREDEDWLLDAAHDTTTVADIRSFMLNTRYWWLEGANTDDMRRGIDEIFEDCDIETIAPGYGKILRGRDVVQRHHRLLDDFLRSQDRSLVASRYIFRDEEK